jgi:amino acid transporter
MAMQPGERYLDFDAITTDPYDALEVVAPLVVLDRRDKGEEVVKLSHYSLEEFLCSEKIRHGPAKFFSVVPAEANAWLASICLQYLTFSVFDAPLDEDLDMNARTDYAFRRYAALNWYNHMSSAQHTLGSVDFYQPYLDWFTNSHEGPPCYKRWHDLFLEEFSVRMEFGHSPICFAIRTHLHDLFDYLVSHFHDLDYHFADGYTCLTVAAMMNDIRASHKLVEMGADIGIATLQRELTPLHLAAEFCSVETFNFLVRAGADIHARSYSETTPFYRACRGGNLSIIRTLKEHGADIDARTWDDWTPIYEAVGKGFENVVDLLLEWGADLTVINDDGFSPVALAIDLDDFSVAQKLHQANPNVISATDRTKLEAASK